MSPAEYHKTNLDKTLEEGKRIRKDSVWANFWLPKVGENEIRILPPWSKEGFPFKEIAVHFGVGPDKKTITCLKRYGKACFICDTIRELKNTEDTESQEMATRLYKKNRYLWNIVDLADLKSGVQIYSSGIRVFEGVWAYFADDDWGDITDPAKGYNLTITRLGSGLNTKYQVRARRKPTAVPVLPDGTVAIDNLYDLDAVMPVLSCDEQKQAFEGIGETGLVGEEEAEEEKEEIEEKEEREEKEETEETEDEANEIERVPPVDEKEGTKIGKVLEKPESLKCFGIKFNASSAKCAACPRMADCVKVFMAAKQPDTGKAKGKSDAEKIEDELKRK